MKRSQVVMLLAGGTALAALYAYSESDCQPDSADKQSLSCADRGSGGHASGAFSSPGSGGETAAARGGFGGEGAAHGGGGE